MHLPLAKTLSALSAVAALTMITTSCQIQLGDEPVRPSAVGTFPGPDGPLRAMYTVTGDYAIVGGDIAFFLKDELSLRSNIGDPSARWPGGILVYEIPAGFPNTSVINEAVGVWNSVRDRSGVTLVARTDETSYVRFQNSEQGCFSLLGHRGGVQPINLGAGCGYVGTVVHEIGHAIGLGHEQQRPDRDKYIRIATENIKPEWKSQVAIIQGARAHGAYDYDSVMHYPAYAASVTIDPSKPYMESLMPGVTTEMLGGDALTAGDVAGVAVAPMEAETYASTPARSTAMPRASARAMTVPPGSGRTGASKPSTRAAVAPALATAMETAAAATSDAACHATTTAFPKAIARATPTAITNALRFA